MAYNRNTSNQLFELDFQISTAIILMLDQIRDLQSLRLAGSHANIELTLNTGKKILAHTAAVQADSDHVLDNLEEALHSLSEGAQEVDAQELIFITNSANPFKGDASKGIFSSSCAWRSYADLPESAQSTITDCLKGIAHPLDLDKFMIQKFQFETDDDSERYRVVQESVRGFIGSFHADVSYGLDEHLLLVWRNQLFFNGTTSDAAAELRKEDLVWPVLALETAVPGLDRDLLEEMDPGASYEASRLCLNVLDIHHERIGLIKQVLRDFGFFREGKTGKDRLRAFLDCTWESHKEAFRVTGINDDVLEALTKLILYRIVRRSILIEHVLTAANL